MLQELSVFCHAEPKKSILPLPATQPQPQLSRLPAYLDATCPQEGAYGLGGALQTLAHALCLEGEPDLGRSSALQGTMGVVIITPTIVGVPDYN